MLIKPWSRESGKITRNPHFWAIIFIVFIISLIYILDIIFIELTWNKWLWHLTIFEYRYHTFGILFFIPFIYAALFFWWWGALITWSFSLAVIIPRCLYFSPNPASIVTNIFLMIVPLLLVLFITLELKWREREKNTMKEREAERQNYLSQILKAQEDGRQRIARELHDDTVQRLWVVANQVQKLMTDEIRYVAPHMGGELDSIRGEILSIEDDLRRLSLTLRPNILDELGLVSALRWLVDQLNSDDSVQAKLEVRGVDRTLSPEANINLFRIVQESLNNVRRHSQANQVFVTLEFAPEAVKLTIEDNGIGFSLPKAGDYFTANNKLGIMSMKQRAQLLGGTFDINSMPGKGTRIAVALRP